MERRITRREARILAFEILFEQAVSGEEIKEILSIAHEAKGEEVTGFALNLVLGANHEMETIDQVIDRNSKSWRINRLSKMALAILRLAVYEMMYVENIPVSASINEAIDIAKIYGSEQDAPYINGVLSGVAKNEKVIEKGA